MQRPRVFFDFAIDKHLAGRVIFELFNDTAPKTCENFRALCTGEKGVSSAGHTLYYKNSIVHRSIKDFMIQGGDFTKHNGAGGESIYGGMFADEDLERPVDAEALLCMANRGPNTNGSQFFITLRACPHLNGKHVVFGRVIRGYETLEKIALTPTDAKDRPTIPVTIINCGELELRRKANETAQEASRQQEQPAKETNRKSRSKRSKSRSRSPDSDSDRSRTRHKKRKSKKHDNDEQRDDGDRGRKPTDESVPQQETEEEYDARLEREEKERFAAERKKHLERLKSLEGASKDGVRFKGRGRMKYIDPEISHRQ